MKLFEILESVMKMGGLPTATVVIQVKDDTNSFVVDDLKYDPENNLLYLDVKEVDV